MYACEICGNSVESEYVDFLCGHKIHYLCTSEKICEICPEIRINIDDLNQVVIRRSNFTYQIEFSDGTKKVYGGKCSGQLTLGQIMKLVGTISQQRILELYSTPERFRVVLGA